MWVIITVILQNKFCKRSYRFAIFLVLVLCSVVNTALRVELPVCVVCYYFWTIYIIHIMNRAQLLSLAQAELPLLSHVLSVCFDDGLFLYNCELNTAHQT